MDLSVRTETFGNENQSWLGSAHGTSHGQTITLDVSKFTAGTHYPNGYLPSGTALGKVTATSKYGPYDDTASDGRQTLVGFLLNTTRTPASSATPIAAALLEHGRVKTALLPFQSGAGAVDANGKTDVAGRIWFA